MDVWLHSKLSNQLKNFQFNGNRLVPIHSINFDNANYCRGFDVYIYIYIYIQYMYDIVSAIEISVLYDMIPYNISSWHDINMMEYDARMVYYCNESIWYCDKIYQFYMIYRCDVIYQYDITRQQWYDNITRQQWYDISEWHDTTAVWYDTLSQTCVTGIMTFLCFDPSLCWPFVAPVFGVSAFSCCFFTRQCGHIEEIIATNDLEPQKSEILSRGSFSSLLVLNITTHFFSASFIVDVYLLLRF